MNNRKKQKDIHSTAVPLMRWLTEAKVTQTEASRRLGLRNIQTMNQWFARGVPAERMFAVADLCGMSIDEYRVEAGLISAPTPNIKASQAAKHDTLIANFDALPEGLQNYILGKVKEIRKYSATLPGFILETLHPPLEKRARATWERDLTEHIISLNGLLNDANEKEKGSVA